jgi:hypothetical protein
MTQKIDVHITRADGSEIVLRDQSSANPAVRRRINSNLDTAKRIEVVRHVTAPAPPPPLTVPSIHMEPGLFTVTPRDESAQHFYDIGFRWIIRQAQNDVQIQPFDLSAWRNVGFKTGVWGVTYDAANFARDGHALATQANQAGPNGAPCDLLLIDAEECLKNADPAPLIQALAAFKGPKGLSTLGAASGDNVFPINYKAFLDAGYDIYPQAYYGWALEYEPAHVIDHAKRAGIPLDRLHLTIDSSGENQPAPVGLGRGVQAAEWVSLVQATVSHGYRAGPDISVFMQEFDYDYAALKPIL